MWIAILSVAFVAVGYLFYGLDRLLKSENASISSREDIEYKE
jgi:hypothetical protein